MLEKVGDWARTNTVTSDIFLNTLTDNFEIVSWRSSIGNASSALVWVNPLLYDREATLTDSINSYFDGSRWDLAGLLAYAKQLNTNYVLIGANYSATFTPVFTLGKYAIFRVP